MSGKKDKLKPDVPTFLQRDSAPTLTDEDGEKEYPLVIDAMRSKWTPLGRSWEGMSINTREEGRSIKLTLYFRTSKQMAELVVTSLITMFDELEAALRDKTLILKFDSDFAKKSRLKLEAPLE